MCCIQLEEQLYRNYNELYSMIMQSYKDISILAGYDKLQTKRSDLYNNARNISNHMVRLAQKDLALTIYKIYLDTNPNANTIPKFRNIINEKLRGSGNADKQRKNE